MLDLMISKWWLFAVRGVIGIVFGALAFLRPELTLFALVGMFGIYALLDGVVSLGGAFTLTGSRYFWWLLFEGIVGIAAGLVTFLMPGLAALSLLIVLAVWLIFGGIFRIAGAIELRKEIRHEWLYIVSGAVSIIAGAITLYGPFQTALAWVWVIGFYAILFGLMQISLSYRLNRLRGGGSSAGTFARS